MFLEEWVHDKVKRVVEETNGLKIPSVSRQDIERYQIYKIRQVLKYVYERNVAYREQLDGNGVTPKNISSITDVSQIPFTEIGYSHKHPYKYLCVSHGDVARVFSLATSGTTGRPKKLFFTMGDANSITDYMSAIINTVIESSGISIRGFTGQIFLPDSAPLSHANLVVMGVKKMGGTGYVGLIKSPIQEQVDAIQEVSPIMLMGSASRIHRITQTAKQSFNTKDKGVKIVFITSEYLSQAMRKQIEESWNAEVYHHYGMSEAGLAVAVECKAHLGFHYSEEQFFFEVIDPKSGRVLQNGENGELVVTTLDREGTPLIRYKTGDIGNITFRYCTCGASTLPTISVIKKRVQPVIKIGNTVEIYSSLFDDVLYSIPELIDYRMVLTTDGEKESLFCKVDLSSKNGNTTKDIFNMILSIPQINQAIKVGLLSHPFVEEIKQGDSFSSGRGKQKIIDHRNQLG